VVGGAFGGREDISVQIVLALAAWKTGRPVKTVWSREESIVGHHKRHPYTITAKWGATRAGKIVAAQMDLDQRLRRLRVHQHKGAGQRADVALGPYQIPNVHVVARTVYTNNTPSGAFRGFGGPQGHFAAEMQVNKLAEALGIDPVELRMRNLWQEGMLPTKSPLPAGCTAPEVLAAAAERGGLAPGRRAGLATRGQWGAQAPWRSGFGITSEPHLLDGNATPHGARRRHRLLLQECRLQPGRAGILRGVGGTARTRRRDRARGRRLRRRRGGAGRTLLFRQSRPKVLGLDPARSRCAPNRPKSPARAAARRPAA
jgi:CO/xanthine dehydrogenase Mo-binding subunit